MSTPPPEPDRLAGAPHPRHTARLFGQQAAEQAFAQALGSGRMHHAWLIAGPRGVGKATLAWRIARHVLACPPGPGTAAPATLDVDAGTPVARRVAQLSEPGLFVLRRPVDEKTGRLRTAITIDEVRRLKSFFALSAADGGWRVVVIDSADELNGNAANALLKLLEEPPARCLLLLVAHRPSGLLPTIRSRCRVLRCTPLGPEDLASALNQALIAEGAEPVSAQAASALHSLSDGSAGEAIRLIEAGGPAAYDTIAGLLADAPGISRVGIIALAERCAGRGTENAYDATCRLILLALARLARAGAGGVSAQVSGPEARMQARLAPGLAAAQLWAELRAELDSRLSHAAAVNLDPAQMILDTFVRIDTAARAATATQDSARR